MELHNDEWTATEWSRVGSLETFDVAAPVICRMYSPFYKGERYAVLRGNSVLAKNGDWEYHLIPSDRDYAFYKRCRFDSFDEAVAALEATKRKATVQT